MNGVIGTVSFSKDSILCGDHHIIENAKMQDGIKNLQAGELLVSSATGYKKATEADEGFDAVLLEDFNAETKDTVLNVCIHGTVRAEKLLLAGTAATEETRAKLRIRGIYAVGKLA